MIQLSKAVWANGPLKTFLSSQTLSLWGTWLQYLALAAWLYQETGSALWLGTLAAGQQMVVMLASPWAGHVSRLVGVRRMYARAQLIGAAGSAIFTILALTRELTPLLGLAFALVLSFSGAIEGACRQAFLLGLTGGADPHEAVGLDAIVYNLAKILGPILGALAYDRLGLAWCFGFNCLSFLIAYAAVSKPRGAEDRPARDISDHNLWGAMRELARTKDIQKALFGYALCGFCVSPHLSMFPALHASRFSENAASLGWLYSIGGVGGLLGSMIMSSLSKQSRPALLAVGAGLCCSGLAGLALSTSLPMALLWVALLNLGGGFCLSTMQVLLLSTAQGPQRALAIGVGLSAYYGAYMLGALALGAIGQAQGIAFGYLAMTACFLCLGLWLGAGLLKATRERLS